MRAEGREVVKEDGLVCTVQVLRHLERHDAAAGEGEGKRLREIGMVDGLVHADSLDARGALRGGAGGEGEAGGEA